MYEKFEKLLKERGITVYRLSKDIGISQSTLSDWKRGRSVPKQDKLIKIAEYFDVTLDYFVGNSNNSNLDNKYDIGVAVEEIILRLKDGENVYFLENPLDSQTKEVVKSSLENILRIVKFSSEYNNLKNEIRIASR